jgi:hypothetical protein
MVASLNVCPRHPAVNEENPMSTMNTTTQPTGACPCGKCTECKCNPCRCEGGGCACK